MAWLRRGDWHPTRGTWVPALLTIQLVTLGQALLRGADYVRSPRHGVPDLAALTPPPLWAWGLLFCAGAVAGLVGIGGHWGTLVAVGHCAVAIAYLCVGVALLEAVQVASWVRIGFGVAVAASGAILVRYRPPDPRAFTAVRTFSVLLLIAGTLGMVDGMGHDFRGATGQLAAACIHGTLGLAVLRIVQRQRIRARMGDTL